MPSDSADGLVMRSPEARCYSTRLRAALVVFFINIAFVTMEPRSYHPATSHAFQNQRRTSSSISSAAIRSAWGKRHSVSASSSCRRCQATTSR